jgi:O-antigen ligase
MVDRAISGLLSNPNGLAEWFGFCAVYFAIFGLETKRGLLRTALWLAAVGCLFIVGLTVSRGAMLATAVAIVVGFRRIFRRGFLPVLLLIILAWVTYESGLFGQSASLYAERSTEETGRFLLWPLAIERFFSSPLIPLIGVGASDVATYVPLKGEDLTPHNSFIYFGLSSGVVPLAFFIAFFIRGVRRSFSNVEQLEDGPFRMPFLIFTFVSSLLGDLGFMTPYGLLALIVGIGPGTDQIHRVLVVHRSAKRERAYGRPSEAANLMARRRP